jgi:ASC-1-like (ASCH) protein
MYYKIEIKYINININIKQLYLYKMSIYEKNLSEPWFSLIKLRIKKVEGRLNKGDFANMNIGDFILFTNNELGFERNFKIQIKYISYYDNFKTYLENETLEKCLPGIDNIEDGLNVYYKYYKKEDELEYKIKAFTF